MRGLLRIASARTPFRRAGLAWPTAAPVEVHITELDGERLLRLIRDPVLTIQMSDENGKFQPLPPLDKDATAAQFQRTIDHYADDAPPVAIPPVIADAAELERLTQVDAAWHADQKLLHDQGFQTLDALTTAWAADRMALNDKTAEFETAQADNARLLVTIAEFQKAVADLNAQREARTAELETMGQRVADLESQLAAAAKPVATKAKAKAD
jgi:hypothetical protein